MTAFDFLRWCFSDVPHGLLTLFVMCAVGEFLINLVKAARGKGD